MPVYSFECPICGARFDERMSFQDHTDKVTCPNGHPYARRVFSAPSIVFKGSGFYINDSRKQSHKETGSE